MALTQRDANRVIENIIDEIKQYVEPEDIFDEDKLKDWAKAKEVDDIFDFEELEYWALHNGYVKKVGS